MAKQNDIFNASNGSVWVQPYGPNHEKYLLTCQELADLVEPKGDVTQYLCVNPHTGRWERVLATQAPADRPSTTLTARGTKKAQWMESHAECPMAFYLHQYDCARADTFLGFTRGTLLPWAVITQQTDSNLMMRDTADPAESAWEISSDWLTRYYQLLIRGETTAATEEGNDITFGNLGNCVGPCGPRTDRCNDGVIACDANAGVAVANILVTRDGGATWTARAGPFVNTCHLVSVVMFPVGPTTTRILVVRSTLAATALQVAYSDDWGVSWVTVNVGATVTEAAQWNGALFALDEHHIWCVANAGAAGTGNIYFSNDGGLTWTLQTAATTDAENYVKFLDEDTGMVVGDTDEIFLTTDGGATWTAAATAGAVSGQDILCCDILDQNRMWIGYDDATLYFTEDGGATWTQRVFTAPEGGATLGQINDIMFVDDYVGFFLLEWDDAGANDSATIYRTVDGGNSWEPYTDPSVFAATGLESIWACDANTAFACGDLVGGVTRIVDLKRV